MCVVGNDYCGLGGGRDGGGMFAGQSRGLVACREMLEYFQSAR